MQCNCFDCPLYKKGFERKIENLEKCEADLDEYDFVYDVWCDKLGGKGGWYGYCEDAFEEDITQTTEANKKRSSKRTRRDNHIRRVNNIYNENKRWMSPYYEHNGRLIQSNFAWRSKRYYKKYSNKQVRKYNKEIKSGNSYRKIFDYWWTID